MAGSANNWIGESNGRIFQISVCPRKIKISPAAFKPVAVLDGDLELDEGPTPIRLFQNEQSSFRELPGPLIGTKRRRIDVNVGAFFGAGGSVWVSGDRRYDTR